MEQWRIHRDRGKCDKPGCPLAAEETYYAVLQLPECLRIERCTACFQELKAEAGEALPFHWQVRRKASGKTEPVLDMDSLRQLFDALGRLPEPAEAVEEAEESADEPATDPAGLRYLVALLLLRKRRLKMVDARNPEEEAADLVVVDPKQPDMEPVALFAPELDPERLGGLREELMAAIEGQEQSEPSSADGS